jgi:NAD(P)-dependent dehydrogenase (short-subunit alcohol dehydrogenase family)
MSSRKTLLLTGATGLIGRRLARHFLEQGQIVVATSRRRTALDALAAELAGLPGTLVPLEIDLLSADLHSVASDLRQRGLSPHQLVNNARDLANLSPDATGWPRRSQWIAEFELGVVIPAQFAVALATENDSRLEAVVNIASIYGNVASNPHLYDDPKKATPVHYGVAKAALLHLTKELAVRLAPRGIRANAVSYGGVEGRADEAFKTRYARLSPSGRMLHVDEVPGVVEFLLSRAASATTGHNLLADGGWTLW